MNPTRIRIFRSPSRLARTLPLFACVLSLAAPGHGGALIEALQARQQKINDLLAKHPGALPPEVKTEVGLAVSGLIDFPVMAQASIGAAWEKQDARAQKAYVEAFEELVRANIMRRVDIYRTEAIDYQDEKIDGDAGSARTIVRSRNATTEVLYNLRRADGKWRIVDYSIDGVSAVRNYKSQFAKLLEKKGWEALVERLKKRKGEIDREGLNDGAGAVGAATPAKKAGS